MLTDLFSKLQSAEAAKAQQAQTFFDTFAEAYREARTVRRSRTPHLNVLGIFGLQFAELRHSDVLAWFLNPASAHEQGPLFLHALLQLLQAAPFTGEHYTVLRERHARTDVAVYARGGFAVFIENKVRHTEREEQVADMVSAMCEVARHLNIPPPQRFAVFLTDHGGSPRTGPLRDTPEFLLSNLVPCSRLQIFECFLEALHQAPSYSPLLLNFLENYLHSIRRLKLHLA